MFGISCPKPDRKLENSMIMIAGIFILAVFEIDLLTDPQLFDPGIKGRRG
jgi:hypothetical protein